MLEKPHTGLEAVQRYPDVREGRIPEKLTCGRSLGRILKDRTRIMIHSYFSGRPLNSRSLFPPGSVAIRMVSDITPSSRLLRSRSRFHPEKNIFRSIFVCHPYLYLPVSGSSISQHEIDTAHGFVHDLGYDGAVEGLLEDKIRTDKVVPF